MIGGGARSWSRPAGAFPLSIPLERVAVLFQGEGRHSDFINIRADNVAGYFSTLEATSRAARMTFLSEAFAYSIVFLPGWQGSQDGLSLNHFRFGDLL